MNGSAGNTAMTASRPGAPGSGHGAQADGGAVLRGHRLGDDVLARQRRNGRAHGRLLIGGGDDQRPLEPDQACARRTAAASSDSGPPSASSCLGRARRLEGHSRVPEPPPRMTANA